MSNKRKTAKEQVLEKFPKAYAKYVGLTLKFVIVNDYKTELSRYRLRERNAWSDAVTTSCLCSVDTADIFVCSRLRILC